MNILAVDDEPVSLRLIQRFLEREGHDVAALDDGPRAWEQFDQNPARLVISDWDMPGLNGMEFCRRIRSRPRTSYTYFIILTARAPSTENLREAVESGVDDFLTKPVGRLALWSRVRVAERVLRYTTQIGQLKDLLPICMYCKKIRDDNQYWQTVENYIHEQTGTDFTHGICPQCYENIVEAEIKRL